MGVNRVNDFPLFGKRKEAKPEVEAGARDINGLAGCAPSEGDYDVCDGQGLKVSTVGPNPSEEYPVYDEVRPNVIWQLSVKDCENKPVTNVTAQCDFDGDGNYDNEAEFSSEADASAITVSQKVSTGTPNPINCIVSDKDGNDGTADIYPPYNAQKAQVDEVKTQCDYAQNKPTISHAYVDNSSLDDNGNIVFGSNITIVVKAKGCDDSQDNLEVFITAGPYNKIPMEKGADNSYRATLKVTTNFSNPATILVADNAKNTYTEEARYFLPNTVPANSSVSPLSCEATDNKPAVKSGLSIVAGVDGNNKAIKGAPITFAVALEDCDGDNSDVDVTLFIGDDSIDLIDNGSGTYAANVPAANWGAPLTAYVIKNGEITQELQLWNLPVVVSAQEAAQDTTPPQASIVGPYVAKVGEPVPFMAAEPDEGKNTYTWDFDNGKPAVEGAMPAMPVYEQSGTYTVMLTVARKDNPNIKTTVTQNLTVIPADQEMPDTTPPQASIIAPDWAYAGVDVPISTTNPNEELYTYQWNFGDGTTVINTAVPGSHAYEQPGTYQIQLTVTKNDLPEIKTVVSRNITIVGVAETAAPNPIANLEVNPGMGAIPLYTTINAANSFAVAEGASIASYYVDFGDGTHEENGYGSFTHIYTTAGDHTVFLIVTDTNGKTATASYKLPTWEK